MHTQQGSYDQTFYAFYRITYKVYFARQSGFLAKEISATIPQYIERHCINCI